MAGTRRETGAKRRRILEAARELFLRDGFVGTSMDAVTSRAGVSKATVYVYFPSKDDLFASLVRETATPILDGLPPLKAGAGDIAEQLRRFLVAVRKAAFTEGQGWERLGIAEATRSPEIGRLLYATGPMRIRVVLTDFLASAGCAEPALAAETLMAVALVAPVHRMLLGVADAAHADPEAGLPPMIRALLRAHPPRSH